MVKIVAAFLGVLGLLGTILFLSFLLSFPVLLLWNVCLVGAVSGVHEITWLQAWGINVLCGFLFQSSISTKN
jgi:multidrug efflux pump subunit AcrB